jgi:hypothetical protein
MSNSKLTIANITYTHSDSSIIVGELSISTEAHVCINVPPVAEQVHSHIILQKNDDVLFKNLMTTSPVNPFSISIYDQRGFLCNTWDSKRDNNSSGNVRITTDNMELLSNIVFPTVPDGEQIYLVINSYSCIDSCTMKQTKKYIIKKDIEMLEQKVDVSNIILFTTAKIYHETFVDNEVYLPDIFNNVYIYETNVIQSLCEYIAGKTVYGSKPSFQGMLNFGANTDVSVGIFSQVEGEQLIDCQVRRNGRIHINTSSLTSSVRFFVMLDHNHNRPIGHAYGSPERTYENLCITEETTGLSFPIVPYTPDKLVGLTETHLQSIIDTFKYYNYLNNENNFDILFETITKNPDSTMLYMFKNPLKFAELIVTDDKYSKLLVEYSSSLHEQIIDFYNTIIMQANSEVFPSNISLTRSYAVKPLQIPKLTKQSSIPYS